MITKDQKLTIAGAMAEELRTYRYVAYHSRPVCITRASQTERAEESAKPLPSYVPAADQHGKNNVGRVWRF
jgi:hypothetical protein